MSSDWMNARPTCKLGGRDGMVMRRGRWVPCDCKACRSARARMREKDWRHRRRRQKVQDPSSKGGDGGAV